VTDVNQDFEVVVVNRRERAPNIISFELARTDGEMLPRFSPGSHVNVEIEPGLVRQYSIASAPSKRDRYLFGVLRETKSRGGSERLHAAFHDGRKVRIGAPRNHFPLDETASQTILLAGGIGITPLLSMAYRLNKLGADFRLHYCTRSRDRTAFIDELMDAALAEKVHLHHDDGDPEQLLHFARDIGVSNSGKHLYVCGPSGFIDHIVEMASTGGWTSNIHVERFTAAPVVSGNAFTVVAAKSGVEVEVTENCTIVEALATVGVHIPLSCEQGICGTCLCDVVEGVPDHRDCYQTDEEKTQNSGMTPCCSRSLTARLVLNV
jgi:vanillate monooxygenase ferredoxin subunit